MRVVLDANVVVAAFVSSGTCTEVFRACVADHQLFRSEAVADEVRRILTQRIKLPPDKVEADMMKFMQASELVCPVSVPANACRDPRDLHVLGLSRAAKADVLVTGDADLLVLRTDGITRIVRPEVVLRELTDSPPAPSSYPTGGGGAARAAERRRRYGRARHGRRKRR